MASESEAKTGDQSATQVVATSGDADSSTPVSLHILETIKVAQSQNGLRHEDYLRYRQYCARRLARLRKSLKLTNGKKEYRKKAVLPEHIKTARHLCLPLMDAERAWAHAMQIKQNMDEDNQRTKFHLRKRLKKAVHHANQLVVFCKAAADARTQLEAEAYCAWMTATVLLENEDMVEALKQFTHAKEVYTSLGKISELEQQHLCQEKVAQLEPSIRYCTYMIKRAKGGADGKDGAELLREIQESKTGLGDILSGKLQAIADDTRHAQAQTMSAVTWQGQRVPVKNEKTRMLIIEAKENTAQLRDMVAPALDTDQEADLATIRDSFADRQDIYGKVLTCFDDAIQNTRLGVQQATAGFKSGTKQVVVDQLNQLIDYLTFNKLVETNKRNKLMAQELMFTQKQQQLGREGTRNKKVKPDELVILFSRMIGFEEARADTGNAAEDAALRTAVDAEIASLKAFRLFFIAESYRLVGKWTEAYALFTHTQGLIGSAQKMASHSEDTVRELAQLATDTAVKLATVQASASLEAAQKEPEDTSGSDLNTKMQNLSLAGVKGDQRTLLERVDEYSAGDTSADRNIVDFPPNYLTVPCKPILFDLAFNDLQYPDLSGRFTEASKPKEEPKPAATAGGGGWFGWMRGGQ